MNTTSIFKHIKRDALAGTVSGVMAIPLTIGICLMSDYPIMTGLYTVILAGVISFITYLFRPGNYTGVPGVAAGLAPALALGVSSFGMQNMPFVILLTVVFQIIVWRFKFERYILRVIPHYLVEGLLAGVGLKIALKFVPFLYDTEHQSDVWLDYEREVVLILSLISFALFVLLYKFYKKKMPALPYFIIMVTSIGMTFLLPLPKLSIDPVPFKLIAPLPHIEHLNTVETVLLILKMAGFAIMLGTIDVIEQVMSNVAIEKMDPLERKTNTNNSLLAIWIANLGATFFGGMTNLDGLAKSTTNTVAGAVTKLSNLFTSLFILIVVLNPVIITALPEYALGIIMVYSGWKMIANIAHVQAEGRYALILSGVCGLLVFKLGIFEGLLLVLFAHAIIQFIFMKRLGKSTTEIFHQFKSSFNKNEKIDLELKDLVKEPDVPVLNKWLSIIEAKNIEEISAIYNENAVLVPPFSTRIRTDSEAIKAFYTQLFLLDDLKICKQDITMNKFRNLRIDAGSYTISWSKNGVTTSHLLSFSIVVHGNQIISHHNGIFTNDGISISRLVDQKTEDNFIF